MNQVPRVTQKSVDRIGEVASDLLHPLAIGIDSNASDLDGTSLELHHEEHRVANGAEDPQDFHVEEVARVQAVPVRPHELLPGPPLLAFRSGDDARFMKDVGNSGSADIDLQTNIHCIANLGVTPGEILLGNLDDEIANFFGFGRTAFLPR